MSVLLPFFIILLAGLFFSELSRDLHLPWVIALIFAGILLGPGGLSLFETDPTLSFLGDVGLIFLMFMAGLETRLSTFSEYGKSISVVAFLSGIIPFIAGIFVAYLFGYSLTTILLVGVVFISSSIAVVVPALERNGLLKLKLGKIAVASSLVNDILSLILLSLVIQSTRPLSQVPLPIFYLLLFAILIALRWAVPRVRKTLKRHRHPDHDFFEQELRVIFTIMIGTAVLFGLLGLHPITAGFFAGLVLSESVESKKLLSKLHAIGYGLFVPAFFVIVGARTDLSVFQNAPGAVALALALVFSSVFAKFISGSLGGLIVGLSKGESVFLGFATIPQLSTTLAVVFAGYQLGILDPKLNTAMVVLTMTTTFIGPFAINRLAPVIRSS